MKKKLIKLICFLVLAIITNGVMIWLNWDKIKQLLQETKMKTINEIAKLCQDGYVAKIDNNLSWEDIELLIKHKADVHCDYCQHSFLPEQCEESTYNGQPICPNCRMQ